MWCNNCRQDVPGIVVADGAPDRGAPGADAFAVGVANTADPGSSAPPIAAPPSTRFVCAHCHEPLGRFTGDGTGEAEDCDDSAACGGDSAPSSFEAWQWELDQDLQDVRRLLLANAPKGARVAAASDEAAEMAGSDFATRHGKAARRGRGPAERCAQPDPLRSHHRRVTRRRARPAALAWFVLSLGLMALVCGGVLLGWSVVTARPELWQLGLPVAVGGQAVMLVGLLLLLERIWRDNDLASEKLDHVDHQIDDLRQATTRLDSSHRGGPQSFYTHMAEGAHPSLLLSDLKAQLEALDAKVATR